MLQVLEACEVQTVMKQLNMTASFMQRGLTREFAASMQEIKPAEAEQKLRNTIFFLQCRIPLKKRNFTNHSDSIFRSRKKYC